MVKGKYFRAVLFLFLTLNSIACLKEKIKKLKHKVLAKKTADHLEFELLPYENQEFGPKMFKWKNVYSLPSKSSKPINRTEVLIYVENHLKDKGFKGFEHTKGLFTAKTQHDHPVEIKIFDFDDKFFNFNKSEGCCIGKTKKYCKECKITNTNYVFPVEIAIPIHVRNAFAGIQKLLDVGTVVKIKKKTKVLKIFIGVYEAVDHESTLKKFAVKCLKTEATVQPKDSFKERFASVQQKLYDLNNELMAKRICHNDLDTENIIIESHDCDSEFHLKLINFKSGVLGLKKYDKGELTVSRDELMFNRKNTKTSIPELNLKSKHNLELKPLLSFGHGLIAAELCTPSGKNESQIRSVVRDNLISSKPKKIEDLRNMDSSVKKFEPGLDSVCHNDKSLNDFLKETLVYDPRRRLKFTELLSFVKVGK
jgi:hypothetical protein